jgi:hypothetical protein
MKFTHRLVFLRDSDPGTPLESMAESPLDSSFSIVCV